MRGSSSNRCLNDRCGRTQITETRDSLLLRLRDDTDHDAWCDFVDVYRPLIYRIARQQGLQDADAQHVAQRVLVIIANKIPEWELEQQPGSFRRWLRRVALNAVIDWFRMQRRDTGAGGSGMLAVLQSQPAAAEVPQLSGNDPPDGPRSQKRF
jgi:RNA polymerase sigma-70 factor (ECF subfamily)